MVWFGLVNVQWKYCSQNQLFMFILNNAKFCVINPSIINSYFGLFSLLSKKCAEIKKYNNHQFVNVSYQRILNIIIIIA